MTELETGPLTPEEREGFATFLASGGIQPLTLTPAPPGPNPGQPGHFAHHNWLETSVKSLSLPAMVTTYLSSGVAVTSATPVALGCDASIVNPDPTKTLMCVVFIQSQATVSAGLTAAINTIGDGATTIAAGVRGEEARIAAGAGTVTFFATRTVILNPGTSRVRMAGAIAAGSGSQTFSFNKITVQPVGWV